MPRAKLLQLGPNVTVPRGRVTYSSLLMPGSFMG